MIGGRIAIDANTAATAAVMNRGTITGAAFGVVGAETVTNFSGGTISGGIDAVMLAGQSADKLAMYPGAVFIGSVDGGNTIGASSVSTLYLASGTSVGTLSGLGTSFTNFASIAVEGGAQWIFSSDNAVAAGIALDDAGSLTITGRFTNAGDIAGLAGSGIGVYVAAATFSNSGTVLGGSGNGWNWLIGSGSYGRGGGDAISSLKVDGGILWAPRNTITNSGLIAGGVGAAVAGYLALPSTGGGGGAGLNLASGIITNNGTIGGGAGGGNSVAGGAGGSGGLGIALAGGELYNNAFLTGGSGGAGHAGVSNVESASNGAGGSGGVGLALFGAYATNIGEIMGGAGGAGGSSYGGTGRAGGAGGAGVVIDSGVLFNSGTIIGGDGGAGGAGTVTGAAGIGGIGVYASHFGGDVTIINLGTIIGAGGADAVQLDGALLASRIVVGSSAAFIGTVDGGHQPGGTIITTLELASGGSAGTLSGLGSQFVGFNAFKVDAGATWVLSGANTLPSGIVLTDSGTLSVTGMLSVAGSIIGTTGLYGLNGQQGGNGNGLRLSSATFTNTGSVAGGRGGSAIVSLYGYVCAGGAGAAGMAASGSTIMNAGGVAGGSGGDGAATQDVGGPGGNGGAGGAGMVLLDSTLTNAGTIAAGQGGDGGRSLQFPGGSAGTGGTGVSLTGGELTNKGVILGGAGGGSGTATNTNRDPTVTAAPGAAGGTGVYVADGATLANLGRIAGGSGGNGAGLDLGVGGAGGSGGDGVVVLAAVLINSGIISGSPAGAAGAFSQAGSVGIAGTGVYVQGGGTVANNGTITGAGGANSVLFLPGYISRLVVDPTATFVGAVNGGNTIGATAVSTLELAAGSNAGTLTGVGTQFVNFGSIVFDQGAHWSISGDAAGLAGTISGFAAGDTIDISGITATGSSYAAGVLTLDDASGTVALNLAGNGFTAADFAVTNTAGGAEIALDTVTLHGASSEYTIADNTGALYVQDNGTAGDSTQTLPFVTTMLFTDGTGVFDPTGTAEDVARLYGAAFNRSPDLGGLQYWIAQINSGTVSLATAANEFTQSAEFLQDYGTPSDASFVNQLYENVLGRPADQAGLQYWQQQLADGASRGQVLLGFAESEEYINDKIAFIGDPNYGEAYRLYQAALDRAPDPTGLAYWISQMSGGLSPLQAAQGFVESAEFQNDYGSLGINNFVSLIYENVLHRPPDPTGFQYWTTMMEQGVGQATVLLGFSDSLENRVDTAAATHDGWVFIPTQT